MKFLKYITLLFVLLSSMGVMAGTKYTVTANDAASLQSQFNLLLTGDTLYIPNGTYTITADTSFHFIFSAKEDIVFEGQSRENTIINFAGYTGIHVYAGQAIFKNLTIKNAINSALYCDPDGQQHVNSIVNIENVRFENNGGTVGAAVRYNFTTPDGAYPISIKDCEFISNIATQNGGAIYIQAALTGLTIEGNVFTGNSCQDYGGAIYIETASSSLSLDQNIFTTNTSVLAGGGVYIGATAGPTSFYQNVFTGNDCTDGGSNGGAIYFGTASSSLAFDQNILSSNSCSLDGDAIYILDIKNNLTLENNLLYSNGGGYTTLYLDLKKYSYATGIITIRNNTIAKNSSFGFVADDDFDRFTIDFDNNIIVDNSHGDDEIDFISDMLISGDYNVVETVLGATFDGGSNNVIGVSGDYFSVLSGVIKHTVLGADYTFSKLTSNYPTYDVYGATRDNPSDIGAFEVSLADRGIAYWIETASDYTWTNTANWRRGVVPTSSFSEVYILDCTSGNYPELTTDLDLSSADLDVSSGATFDNPFNLTAKSIYVHSDASGTGEFINDGTISVTEDQFYEQYLIPGQWNFLGIPVAVTAGDLLPDEDLGTSFGDASATYWIAEYDGVNRSDNGKDSYANWHSITADATPLAQGAGYTVWVDDAKTVKFSSSASSDVDVSLSYLEGARSSNQWGWNLIGNPYSTTLSVDAVIDNLGNSDNTTSSIYINILDGDQEDYESRAGGGLGEAAYIPAHQAYFVQSTAISEAKAKMHSGNARFRKGVVFKSSSIAQPSVLIVAVSDSVVRDKAFFRLKEECTDDYDNYWDSYKLTSKSSAKLGVRSVLNGIDYDVNSFSIDEGSVKTIPLYFTVPDNLREMTLSFDLEGFEGSNLYLRDHRNGTLTEVKHDAQYLITLADGQLATSLSDQFSLEIRNSDVVTGECCDILTSENIKVYTTSDGLRVLSEDNSEPMDVVVYDVLGNTVVKQTLLGGSGTISSLKIGVYIVKVQQSEVIESHKVIVR